MFIWALGNYDEHKNYQYQYQNVSKQRLSGTIIDFDAFLSLSSGHQWSVITTITPSPHPPILYVTARPSHLRATCPPATCRAPGCPCLSRRGGPCPPPVAPAALTPTSSDLRPLTSDPQRPTAPTTVASTVTMVTPAQLRVPAVCPPPGGWAWAAELAVSAEGSWCRWPWPKVKETKDSASAWRLEVREAGWLSWRESGTGGSATPCSQGMLLSKSTEQMSRVSALHR